MRQKKMKGIKHFAVQLAKAEQYHSLKSDMNERQAINFTFGD